jgi:hypothetical protein
MVAVTRGLNVFQVQVVYSSTVLHAGGNTCVPVLDAALAERLRDRVIRYQCCCGCVVLRAHLLAKVEGGGGAGEDDKRLRSLSAEEQGSASSSASRIVRAEIPR